MWWQKYDVQLSILIRETPNARASQFANFLIGEKLFVQESILKKIFGKNIVSCDFAQFFKL